MKPKQQLREEAEARQEVYKDLSLQWKIDQIENRRGESEKELAGLFTSKSQAKRVKAQRRKK